MRGFFIFLFLISVEAGISCAERLSIVHLNVRFESDVVEFTYSPDDFINTYLLRMKASFVHLSKYNLELLHARSIALMTDLEICQSLGT